MFFSCQRNREPVVQRLARFSSIMEGSNDKWRSRFVLRMRYCTEFSLFIGGTPFTTAIDRRFWIRLVRRMRCLGNTICSVPWSLYPATPEIFQDQPGRSSAFVTPVSRFFRERSHMSWEMAYTFTNININTHTHTHITCGYIYNFSETKWHIN